MFLSVKLIAKNLYFLKTQQSLVKKKKRKYFLLTFPYFLVSSLTISCKITCLYKTWQCRIVFHQQYSSGCDTRDCCESQVSKMELSLSGGEGLNRVYILEHRSREIEDVSHTIECDIHLADKFTLMELPC